MNALADALKPLAASGPKLLAALSSIQDVSDREALAEAVGAALAEQASRAVAAAATAATGKENSTTTAAAPAPAPAAPAPAPAPPARQLAPLDDAAAIMRGLSVIQPWGSFDVAFFPKDKLVLRTAQKAGSAASSAAASAAANVKELVVPISSVRAVAVLDAVPEEQAAFVLLGLKPAVALPWASAAAKAAASGGGGGELDCLAFRIPNSAPAESLSFFSAAGNSAPIQGKRAVVLCAALGQAGVSPTAFLAPDRAVFSNFAASSSSSSGGSGAGGGCSVRAAVKASQGHLFPLGDRAIAFVKKPALLVSLRSLRAAELARAGGGSASFDLLLHLRGKEEKDTSASSGTRVVEFCQIPRQELAPLRQWLEERGVPLGASSEEGAGAGAKKRRAAAAEEEGSGDDSDEDDEASSSSDDDDDDEDFDPKAAAAELKAQDEAERAEEEEEEGDEEEEAGESSDDDDQGHPAKRNKF